MSQRPTLTVELSAADLDIITWRLCQPSYEGFEGYWQRHKINQEPHEAAWELYERLIRAWEEWAQ